MPARIGFSIIFHTLFKISLTLFLLTKWLNQIIKPTVSLHETFFMTFCGYRFYEVKQKRPKHKNRYIINDKND